MSEAVKDEPKTTEDVNVLSQAAPSARHFENEYVHEVYERIADHFSSTRYKPWPIVERFLLDQRPGSIGLDVGCGNGKYLTVNPKVHIVASDRSANLVKIAASKEPQSAIVADILSLPHKLREFDFAISIAVVHHLATKERRIEALASILAHLHPVIGDDADDAGSCLIYVWALEQRDSRRGWDTGHEQDVMVPWKTQTAPTKVDGATSTTFQRYYHLYRKGELESDIEAAGGEVIQSGYEKDNWWAICRPRGIS